MQENQCLIENNRSKIVRQDISSDQVFHSTCSITGSTCMEPLIHQWAHRWQENLYFSELPNYIQYNCNNKEVEGRKWKTQTPKTELVQFSNLIQTILKERNIQAGKGQTGRAVQNTLTEYAGSRQKKKSNIQKQGKVMYSTETSRNQWEKHTEK